eukprot:3934979-Rhodomonas_salina.1
MWAWCDSKVVFCVSNVHPPILVTAQCWMKGRADWWEGPCPLPMREYNFLMGAIDDFDHLMSFHSCKLRSYKWWHTIFYFLIDVSSINALHLWHIENPEEGQLLEHRTWIAGLIEEILTKYGSKSGRSVDEEQVVMD